MKLKDIENKYEEKGKKFGGVLLLPPDLACNYINEGVLNGYDLCGVEGFKIYGEKIQPCQDYSSDIADYFSIRQPFDEYTKELIKESVNNNIWFEVVFNNKQGR